MSRANLTGEDYCISEIEQKIVAWPFLPSHRSQHDECTCVDLNDLGECSCINNTGYIVERNNEDGTICWKDLTKEMNKTKIIFYISPGLIEYNGKYYAGEEILESYEILIAGNFKCNK